MDIGILDYYCSSKFHVERCCFVPCCQRARPSPLTRVCSLISIVHFYTFIVLLIISNVLFAQLIAKEHAVLLKFLAELGECVHERGRARSAFEISLIGPR